MPLNKVKAGSNMYDFVTHTWNVIKGRCPHNCDYCYMKRFPQKPIRFDEKELKTDLYKDGKGRFIFVGSSCDMWADSISPVLIQRILSCCEAYPANKYLFQSKNPLRFLEKQFHYPPARVFGTTIETNRWYDNIMGNSTTPEQRALCMGVLQNETEDTMVTCEPLLDFDLKEMIALIKRCNPQWVNIGADSQGHKLPEPSKEKVMQLIEALKENNIAIKKKSNLQRLL